MTLAIQEKIQNITEKIIREFNPEKIILFGSYAWGTPTKDSDIDLFIVKDGNKTSLEMMREVNKILLKRDNAMDILVYTNQQLEKRKDIGDPFIKRILESGKVIYAK